MSPSALPQTLTSITITKLAELQKQRNAFESRRDLILAAADAEPSLHARVKILLKGCLRENGAPIASDSDLFRKNAKLKQKAENQNLLNMARLLQQAGADPCISDGIMKGWEVELRKMIELKGRKYTHAQFFSELVKQWLVDPTILDPNAEAEGGKDDSGSSTASSTAFETVGRKEMHEQRQEWESLVFAKGGIDPVSVENYLTGLFNSSKPAKKALEQLQKNIKEFGISNMSMSFDTDDLKWTAAGLKQSDLLTEEKTQILLEVTRNKEVAREIADVIAMRLKNIQDWRWTTDAIPLEMRRQLNGKYRVYMDEDLIDALILFYVGMKWSVAFREEFNTFLHSDAWNKFGDVPKRAADRRRYYLGAEAKHLVQWRFSAYEEDYFLSQLPRHVEEGYRDYGEDGSDDSANSTRKGPLEIKHSLLHRVATEALIQTKIHGEFTVVRSDFKWFGPSMPHSSIFATLKFFGVPNGWLGFFKHFLEAPMYFAQDGPDAQVRHRQRGLPISHIISDMMGEVVLFPMDFAVNSATNSFLHRMHDDFWFWGKDADCVKAWTAMCEFSSTMGLQFNEEKTGTVKIGKPLDVDMSESESESDISSDEVKTPVISGKLVDLPVGDVRWGFLKLSNEGRFVIDQTKVDEHIAELQLQLAACKSVFSWVQAWNSYLARFFSNNFGKPAKCSGREHVDDIVATYRRIQTVLFPSGNVTIHLRGLIQESFPSVDVEALPDGFFYFPVELGGLGLRNPLIEPFSVRVNLDIDTDGHPAPPSKLLEDAHWQDEIAYRRAREVYKTRGPLGIRERQYLSRREDTDSADPSAFLSLSEYTAHPEHYSPSLLTVFTDLMRTPEPELPSFTPEFTALLPQRPPSAARASKDDLICSETRKMGAYAAWIARLYAEEMSAEFGGLRSVENGVVPMGVVALLKRERMKWVQ